MAIYLLHALVISLLVYLLFRWYRSSPLRQMFFPALFLKLSAGVVLGLLYSYYYTYGGDTFLFHKEAALIAKWARQSPVQYGQFLLTSYLPDKPTAAQLTFLSQPRALVMAKIVSVLHLLTGSRYWLSGAYLSLFSFWGMWSLANCLSQIFPRYKWAAAVAFLFFPSVVFWSSGVLKETVAMGIIGFIGSFVCHYRFKWPSPINVKVLIQIVLALYGLFLLWQLKFYYCAVLLLVLVCLWVCNWVVHYSKIKSLLKQLLLFEAILIVMVLVASLYPGFTIKAILTATVQNYEAHLRSNLADPALMYESLQPTLASFLLHAPQALVAGFFRPFFWEAENFFQGWVGFENLLLLAATVLALIKIVKGKAEWRNYFLLWISSGHYSIILAVLLAIAAPNFGELSRYKVAFLPFFIYVLGVVLLANGSAEKIKKR